MKWWELHKALESPYLKRSKWQNLRQPFGKNPTNSSSILPTPQMCFAKKGLLWQARPKQNKLFEVLIKHAVLKSHFESLWALDLNTSVHYSEMRSFGRVLRITLQATFKFLFQIKNLPQVDYSQHTTWATPVHKTQTYCMESTSKFWFP